MRAITKYFAGAAFAALLLTGAANAMQIPQYDKMAQSDKDAYRILLVEGAAKALDAHDEHAQEQKMVALFNDKSPKGGFSQLEKQLAVLRAANKANAASHNTKEPVYAVEHALALTLKDNGIIIPVRVLLAINEDFQPSSPPAAAKPK